MIQEAAGKEDPISKELVANTDVDVKVQQTSVLELEDD